MFHQILFSLLLTILAATTNSVAASDDTAKKTCVLIFERPKHVVSLVADRVFHHAPGVELRQLALPTDFLRCIKDRSTEILIIGHALEESSTDTDGATSTRLSLGYFLEFCGQDRTNEITRSIETLKKQIEAIESYIEKHSGDDLSSEREFNRLSLVQAVSRYEQFPENEPYYVVRPIQRHIMKLARQELAKQAKQQPGVALRKLRIMSCMPEQVLAQYPDLKALVEENGIYLEFAPKSRFWSFLRGKSVTAPNLDWWMKKSLLAR